MWGEQRLKFVKNKFTMWVTDAMIEAEPAIQICFRFYSFKR